METTVINATEYRNCLSRCSPNPPPTRAVSSMRMRLKELAESIRTQGVLSPLLVRPLNERSFEIVAGARRYPCRADWPRPIPCPSASST